MKLLLTISTFLASLLSFSQNDTYSYQLYRIIADAENSFKNLRGEIKNISKKGDTVFHSNVTIEGSSQNEISKSSSDSSKLTYYFSCRLDSNSIKEAKKLVDHFKRKTKKVLDKGYKVETFHHDHGRLIGESRGFIFRGHGVVITIIYNIIVSYPFAYSYLMVHKA